MNYVHIYTCIVYIFCRRLFHSRPPSAALSVPKKIALLLNQAPANSESTVLGMLPVICMAPFFCCTFQLGSVLCVCGWQCLGPAFIFCMYCAGRNAICVVTSIYSHSIPTKGRRFFSLFSIQRYFFRLLLLVLRRLPQDNKWST